MAVVAVAQTPAQAAGPTVDLGTAAPYSALAGQAITNTGPSVLEGDAGVSPGNAVTGFPPGIIGGTLQVGTAVAAQAQADLRVAYDDAAGRASDATVSADLGGQRLVAGTYTSPGSLFLTGNLELDAQGDEDAVFIFQVASTLVTASGSSVRLLDGASACNVFWQVGSSATLGTGSSFVGTVMALTSVTVTTDTTVTGRALARNGAVTLDSDIFVDPGCEPVDTGGGTTTTPVDSTGQSTTGTTPTEPSGTEPSGTGPSTSTPGTTDAPTTPATGSSTAPDGTTPGTGGTTVTTDTTTPATVTGPITRDSGPGTPTTTATAVPRPPRGDGSPPLAYTGSSTATVPALLLGLGLLAAGTATLVAVRRRGATDGRRNHH
jgi:hypothetical protein